MPEHLRHGLSGAPQPSEVSRVVAEAVDHARVCTCGRPSRVIVLRDFGGESRRLARQLRDRLRAALPQAQVETYARSVVEIWTLTDPAHACVTVNVRGSSTLPHA